MPKQLTVLASDGLQAIKPDKSKLNKFLEYAGFHQPLRFHDMEVLQT